MSAEKPTPALIVREYQGKPFYEAKFRYQGRQVKRRIGPAWLERDGEGWSKRKGRVPDGYFEERGAHVQADKLVARYVRTLANRSGSSANARRGASRSARSPTHTWTGSGT